MSSSARGVSYREGPPDGVTRRHFMGWVIAASTVMAGAELFVEPARAAIPTHQPVDSYDLTDFLTDAAQPTSHLITVTVNPDGTVSFALPRAEVGQGITTAVAMTIADEMDISVDKVNVTLADARPELVWNQLTGGSNTMHSIFTPVRVAAAIARGQLLQAASIALGNPPNELTVSGGVVRAPGGKAATFGSLTHRAAARRTQQVEGQLKPRSQYKVIGTSQRRIDAVDIVTGRKQFALDLEVPRRPPHDGVPSTNDQWQRDRGHERGAGQGHARRDRRGHHPAHPVRPRRRGRAGSDVRPVHRRRPRPGRHLGRRIGRRQVRRQCASRPEGQRGPA